MQSNRRTHGDGWGNKLDHTLPPRSLVPSLGPFTTSQRAVWALLMSPYGPSDTQRKAVEMGREYIKKGKQQITTINEDKSFPSQCSITWHPVAKKCTSVLGTGESIFPSPREEPIFTRTKIRWTNLFKLIHFFWPFLKQTIKKYSFQARVSTKSRFSENKITLPIPSPKATYQSNKIAH